MDRPYAHKSLWIYYNIPAFKLTYSKNGNKELESNLLVGKNGLKQWFSAVHQFYCFSPYGMFPEASLKTN
jgi:murein L,D-transpeptidase YcbB/YkuD